MQQRMTCWYLLGYSLSKAMAKTFFHYRVVGAENMIEEGPCIIAANHCSYLDPPLVGVACLAVFSIGVLVQFRLLRPRT